MVVIVAKKPTDAPNNNEELQPVDAASAPVDWSAQVETLRELADIVRTSQLSEIELERGGVRLHLQAPGAARSRPAASQSTAEFSDDEVWDDADTGVADVAAVAAGPAVSEGKTVVSPMVGIFYRAPSPNDPNFVEIGDRVEIGQTLGLVETMKVFNEITSEVEGTVTKIIAQNLSLVETGDALLVVK
jgi:acetyl-CoA carboxylase biotin carboxyl carrier protein